MKFLVFYLSVMGLILNSFSYAGDLPWDEEVLADGVGSTRAIAEQECQEEEDLILLQLSDECDQDGGMLLFFNAPGETCDANCSPINSGGWACVNFSQVPNRATCT